MNGISNSLPLGISFAMIHSLTDPANVFLGFSQININMCLKASVLAPIATMIDALVTPIFKNMPAYGSNDDFDYLKKYIIKRVTVSLTIIYIGFLLGISNAWIPILLTTSYHFWTLINYYNHRNKFDWNTITHYPSLQAKIPDWNKIEKHLSLQSLLNAAKNRPFLTKMLIETTEASDWKWLLDDSLLNSNTGKLDWDGIAKDPSLHTKIPNWDKIRENVDLHSFLNQVTNQEAHAALAGATEISNYEWMNDSALQSSWHQLKENPYQPSYRVLSSYYSNRIATGMWNKYIVPLLRRCNDDFFSGVGLSIEHSLIIHFSAKNDYLIEKIFVRAITIIITIGIAYTTNLALNSILATIGSNYSINLIQKTSISSIIVGSIIANSINLLALRICPNPNKGSKIGEDRIVVHLEFPAHSILNKAFLYYG